MLLRKMEAIRTGGDEIEEERGEGEEQEGQKGFTAT